MEHRRVGSSGLRVSAFGLGSWLTLGQRIDERETAVIVRTALELGVTFIDTADVYGRGAAETALGAVLEGVPRDHFVLASKCFFPMTDHPLDRGLSRKHVRASVDHSLARLRTDYLDLFQCHRFDPETPVEELVRTMDDLVTAGKILHWGVSCWTAAQIDEAWRLARSSGREGPVSNQPQYSLLDREIEAEVIPKCRELGMSQLVFSPLAQGVLTGKYRGGARPAGTRAADKSAAFFIEKYLGAETLAAVDRAGRIAADAGVTLPGVALRWCLRNPGVAAVIVGVSSLAQLRANVEAASKDIPDAVLDAVATALAAGVPR